MTFLSGYSCRVFITDFAFSEAFANQIESKVLAFQKYLTEQNSLKAVQVVANQTVVQANAAHIRSNVAKAACLSDFIKDSFLYCLGLSFS
jgi:prohibitin 2